MNSRSLRFKILIPLRYRAIGESNWRRGWTTEINCSGLLFVGQDSLKPNTSVEISFVLPETTLWKADGEATCLGQIIRAEQPAGKAKMPAIATRIWDDQSRVVLAQSEMPSDILDKALRDIGDNTETK